MGGISADGVTSGKEEETGKGECFWEGLCLGEEKVWGGGYRGKQIAACTSLTNPSLSRYIMYTAAS